MRAISGEIRRISSYQTDAIVNFHLKNKEFIRGMKKYIEIIRCIAEEICVFVPGI